MVKRSSRRKRSSKLRLIRELQTVKSTFFMVRLMNIQELRLVMS